MSGPADTPSVQDKGNEKKRTRTQNSIATQRDITLKQTQTITNYNVKIRKMKLLISPVSQPVSHTVSQSIAHWFEVVTESQKMQNKTDLLQKMSHSYDKTSPRSKQQQQQQQTTTPPHLRQAETSPAQG